MSITPLRLAGALLIAARLATASVGARVQQTSKPAPPQKPAAAENPPSDPGKGQQTPPEGQAGQPAAEGQPAPDQPQRPTFRTDINFVRVDVIVTDKKGEPVTDLSQKDFQVWEDGDPQDVESFKLFKIDALTQTTPARPIRTTFDEESEAQRPDVRLFAYLPRRLSRPTRQWHAGAHRPRRFRADANRAAGHGRHHVPAHADRRRRHGPQSRIDGAGDRDRSTAGSTTTRRATSSKISTRTTRRRSSNRCATTCRCRR